MAKTTDFILNERTIQSTAPQGTVLLDIIRYHEHLSGTKIGCREGDCGACTVLVGEIKNDQLVYRSMTSCLLALANVHGKHIVTVEGLNETLEHGAGVEKLNPVQQAMVDQSGTQCGICTPGFVVSLSGCSLSHDKVNYADTIRAIDGNICRCTGYKSIERAAAVVAEKLKKKDVRDPVKWSVKNGFLPRYFEGIEARLRQMTKMPPIVAGNFPPLSGGTDLYVQKHDTMHHAPINTVFNDPDLKGITIVKGECIIGGGCVVSDLLASKELRDHFPNLEKHLLLVSSTPIRNMGTLAGNFVNASPIGDLTAFFIGLDSMITLRPSKGKLRNLKLKDLYLGYKTLDKRPTDIVVSVRFKLPTRTTHFNFEKVSKRTYLDIASVNSAARLEVKGDVITVAHVSAGGVAPIPKYLAKTSAYLVGKKLNNENVKNAIAIMNKEIAPISDARGTADYKRLLLRQLFFGHFLVLFPEQFKLKELV
ncbi:MAG: FAD binding domain-containing protein [Flavobacteriales bacterium]